MTKGGGVGLNRAPLETSCGSAQRLQRLSSGREEPKVGVVWLALTAAGAASAKFVRRRLQRAILLRRSLLRHFFRATSALLSTAASTDLTALDARLMERRFKRARANTPSVQKADKIRPSR